MGRGGRSRALGDTQVRVRREWALSSYSTEDADLSDVGLVSINSGTGVGFRFGFVFKP